MPTRLGNALRRHEDAVGRPYDLNAVGVMPHIALCAPPEHLAYLNDQRTLLDLSVRLCVVSLLAAAAGFVLLARDGLWLLLCLAPYLLCLLYTSDAADEEDSVDLGGRRIIKKKK